MNSLYFNRLKVFRNLALGFFLWVWFFQALCEEYKASYGLLSPEERESSLSEYVNLKFPQGSGSFPMAIILPGCMGWHPHHTKWEKRLLRLGFAVLRVDSFGARGIDNPMDLRRDVCGGRRVTGDERAGDVISVLPGIWKNPKIQAEKTLLMGWSHGGWAGLDLLAILESRLKPPNLTSMPNLDVTNFRATLLYYPYCGSAGLNWSGKLPKELRGYLFHGSRDVITSPRECKRRIKRLNDRGGNLEFVNLQNASHSFDCRACEVFDKRAFNVAFSMANQLIENFESERVDFGVNNSDSASGDSLMELFEGVEDP